MAKRTLLDMTQEILSDLDSDNVNSISDTVEAEQVATLIKSTYFDLISEMDLPHTGTLFALTASGDTDYPTHMSLPDSVFKVLWIKYDTVDQGDTASKYRDIKYLSPFDFVTMCALRDEDDTDNIVSVTDYSGVELLICKTKDPQYWTSFDDEKIVFDSYDEDVDSTLQSSKIICHGYKEETWTHTDAAIPDLPSNLFPLLVAEAKSTAFELWKEPSRKIEQRAKRLRIRAQRNKRRENGYPIGPNYGRIKGGFMARTKKVVKETASTEASPVEAVVPETKAPELKVVHTETLARMFGYGFLAVVLALYLSALGLEETQIGLLLTLTLVGDTAISLWMSTHADRYGRRRMLALGSLLILGAGLVFIATDRFTVLLAAATVGVINPSGYEVGPFLAIEQAALSQTVADGRRTRTFAWYNLVASFATAAGSLAGGGIARLGQAGGLTALASYRVVLAGYALMGWRWGGCSAAEPCGRGPAGDNVRAGAPGIPVGPAPAKSATSPASLIAFIAGHGVDLEGVVAGQHLGNVRPDLNLPVYADDRDALQKQDPADEFLGVLHLVDRPLLKTLAELFIAPVLGHLGVHHILIDRGQLVGQ